MTGVERKEFETYARLAIFQRRVNEALATIEEALKIAPACVATSLGKDSNVMAHLVQTVAPEIPLIHLATPRQDMIDNYAEVRDAYLKSFGGNWHEILIEEGQTIPQATRALELWRSFPVTLIGLRAEENGKTRGVSVGKYGLIHAYKTGRHKDSYRVLPLGHWTWRDVWAYTVTRNIPYLKNYDHPAAGHKSRSRTTNILPFGDKITVSRRYGRIAQMKAMSPEAYRYLQQNFPHIAAFS